MCRFEHIADKLFELRARPDNLLGNGKLLGTAFEPKHSEVVLRCIESWAMLRLVFKEDILEHQGSALALGKDVENGL